jgi:hypothetical protein
MDCFVLKNKISILIKKRVTKKLPKSKDTNILIVGNYIF